MDNGVRMALDAIHADRLALICGAGLSMASPSNLSNTSALAALAQTRYAALYGLDRPPLPAAIEDQAQFFFEHGELMEERRQSAAPGRALEVAPDADAVW